MPSDAMVTWQSDMVHTIHKKYYRNICNNGDFGWMVHYWVYHIMTNFDASTTVKKRVNLEDKNSMGKHEQLLYCDKIEMDLRLRRWTVIIAADP